MNRRFAGPMVWSGDEGAEVEEEARARRKAMYRQRKARIRKCSNCGFEGHNIRTCFWPVASSKDSATKIKDYYYKGDAGGIAPLAWSRNKALVEGYYAQWDRVDTADHLLELCVRCDEVMIIQRWSSRERFMNMQEMDYFWDSTMKLILHEEFYCEECKDIHEAEEKARYEAEAKAAKAFDEYLDERQESFSLDGFTISSSAVIKKMMPAYYEEELTKWKVKNE